MKAKVKNITKQYLTLPLKSGDSLRLYPNQVKEVEDSELNTPYLKNIVEKGFIQITIVETPKQTVRSAKKKENTKKDKEEK